MSFIDASYFVAELDIPNSDNPAVAERISYFIEKYEPTFLQKLLGYPLYKAFITGMNVVPPASPDARFLAILTGAEYTDRNGYLQRWKGLVLTDNPFYNLSGGFIYKKPQYLKAGTTPGLVVGASSAVFTNWIGWTPIIYRASPLTPDVDYSYDITTGEVDLLAPGDKFGDGEKFFVQFELRTDDVPVIDFSTNESCIANFVYYWYYRSLASQSTGIGEVQTNAENAINISPRHKMISAWNEMHRWVREFVEFMQATQDRSPNTYPEWTQRNRYDALKTFGFINPIF